MIYPNLPHPRHLLSLSLLPLRLFLFHPPSTTTITPKTSQRLPSTFKRTTKQDVPLTNLRTILTRVVSTYRLPLTESFFRSLLRPTSLPSLLNLFELFLGWQRSPKKLSVLFKLFSNAHLVPDLSRLFSKLKLKPSSILLLIFLLSVLTHQGKMKTLSSVRNQHFLLSALGKRTLTKSFPYTFTQFTKKKGT